MDFLISIIFMLSLVAIVVTFMVHNLNKQADLEEEILRLECELAEEKKLNNWCRKLEKNTHIEEEEKQK